MVYGQKAPLVLNIANAKSSKQFPWCFHCCSWTNLFFFNHDSNFYSTQCPACYPLPNVIACSQRCLGIILIKDCFHTFKNIAHTHTKKNISQLTKETKIVAQRINKDQRIRPNEACFLFFYYSLLFFLLRGCLASAEDEV